MSGCLCGLANISCRNDNTAKLAVNRTTERPIRRWIGANRRLRCRQQNILYRFQHQDCGWILAKALLGRPCCVTPRIACAQDRYLTSAVCAND